MKRIITTLVLAIVFKCLTIAKPVDLVTAEYVGQNFLKTRVSSSAIGQNLNLSLVYTSASKSTIIGSVSLPINYFYVFNINQNQGFIIVSADDIVVPVLGYSVEKPFEPNNIPTHVNKWLEGYKEEISYAITNKLEANDEITKNWTDLINGNVAKQKLNKKGSVSPLIKTKWNQTTYYNTFCPSFDTSIFNRTYTGCVATAVAQVMKFWNYPYSGSGTHSYNHPFFGTLSANFDSTTFDWRSMPDQVTSPNKAVANLMYQCGVGVDMQYGFDASGAYVITYTSPIKHCAEYALRTYFGFKSSLTGISKNNYDPNDWLNIMKAELDAGRPVIYDGSNTKSGHCFIGDGYDNNDYLHFNWGWSGHYDGYFLITSLNPSGSSSYNNYQEAIIGIEPRPEKIVYELVVTTDVKVNLSNIKYRDSFTVSTNIKNIGLTTFKGVYYAALFNKDGKFVDYLDSILESSGLSGNKTYTNNLIFKYKGGYTLLPGKYVIKIYYKPVGGYLKQIHSSDINIYDQTNILINNANAIEMNSDILLSPKGLVKGRAASVKYNLINKSGSTFYGSYQLNIFNLNGNFVETIATIKETKGLKQDSTYSSSYLTFTSSTINSDTGTYLLFAQLKSDTAKKYDLVGSTNFQNPIKIRIVPPLYNPDKYEVNNSIDHSYSLSLNYKKDVAQINTIGSNCHAAMDSDYYKIEFQDGYTYTIKAELKDSNNNDSNHYSLDGAFVYSIDGKTWSNTFTDKMTNDINFKGGGTVYFFHSPVSSEEMGTYQLNLMVTRYPILSSSKNITKFTVGGIVGNTLIDTIASTVKLTVNSSVNITKLTPSISISNLSSINPGSGISRDFTNPVIYTVTAQDNSFRVWTITVTKQSGSIIDKFTHSDLIKVFPNPAKDFIEIDMTELQLETNQIQINDMQGKINSFHLSNLGMNNYLLKIGGLRDGIYTIQLPTDKGIINKRIVLLK